VALAMTPGRALQRALALFPDKVSIHCGEDHYTYHGLGLRVTRLTHALRALGVRPGDRVAFLSPNCHRLLEAYFAVPMMGAILLPLNIRLSTDELAFILNDAGASVLFVHPELAELGGRVASQLTTIRHVLPYVAEDGESYESLLAAVSDEPCPYPPVRETDVAELFYTSGTTGHPKGVMLSHRNLYALALQIAAQLPIGEEDVFLHSLPMYHANGWGAPHTVTLMGGSHVIVPYPKPDLVARAVDRYGVTLAYMVPTMVIQLLNYGELARYTMRSFRRLVVGGAAPAPALARTLEQEWGCQLIGAYGLTEHSPVATFALVPSYKESQLTAEERYRLMCLTGQPMVGVQVRLVDDQGMDVYPDGKTPGEILLRSDTVMVGYWNRPDATAETIVDGWLHTGDIATVTPDGFLDIVDRKKDIIVSGGENISSIEIENVLYDHPALLECAVIAVPDNYWGERPAAFVVPKAGHTLTEDALRTWCENRLTGFKIPREFHIESELPKTGTGKIQKNILRRSFWAGYVKQVH
jgi:fatty-acyl-CoA synthase